MNKITLSDALRYMMKQNRAELRKLRGGEPQGKCADCKRYVRADEIAVKCDKCSNTYVCVDCIDKHDHIHDQLSSALRLA